MVISAEYTPFLFVCLRLYDTHDEAVEKIIWFNPETKIASVPTPSGIDGRRLEIGRFEFLANTKDTIQKIHQYLPERFWYSIREV